MFKTTIYSVLRVRSIASDSPGPNVQIVLYQLRISISEGVTSFPGLPRGLVDIDKGVVINYGEGGGYKTGGGGT